MVATWLALSIVLLPSLGSASPIVPTSDDQVIEVLPAAAGQSEDRALRRRWSSDRRNPELSVALANHYMSRAHEAGDPRYAGLAFAALSAWPDAAKAPDAVLLAIATIQQYLHQFDAAAGNLELLVQRQPANAQAWLTLATVRRVQGRYAQSDAACASLATTAAALYAQACAAENAGLHGDVEVARATLTRLIAAPGLDTGTRNWLLTTLAELEVRDGRPAEAEAAYRAALRAEPDAYTAMSFADFLLFHDRDADAAAALQGQVRTDAVLLRLAIIGARDRTPEGLRDVREVRDRTALANERPDARIAHAREQSMFALWVDHAPQRALDLARVNVRNQREPIDVLLLAQAARAASSAEGSREVQRLQADMGLHDERLHALF